MPCCALHAELPANSRAHILQEFNRGIYDYMIAAADDASAEADVASSNPVGGGGDDDDDDEGARAERGGKSKKAGRRARPLPGVRTRSSASSAASTSRRCAR